MSEAMTVETIIEAYWQMQQGFWTRLRFPLRTKNWSDIDVLAYNPVSHILVIAESKVGGNKKSLYVYTEESHKKYEDILEWDHGDYFGFLSHIKLACKDGTIFDNFEKMVKKLIVQVVSNYVILDNVKRDAQEVIKKKIRGDVPTKVELEIMLDSTLDVISHIITSENKSSQGRRYGHPVIDIARELNRYMRPKLRYAGKNKTAIEKELKKTLLKALDITG